jgi:multidrug efflux pump subunit AcrA (membrane-fusion protein)
MTTASASSRRGRYLRIFLASLGVLLVGLAIFLFGVTMEATATATGHVTARGVVELRSPIDGLVEPGWYNSGRFHRLEPGDEVRPGQLIATVHPSAWWQGTSIAKITAPQGEELWLVAAVEHEPGQAVRAGQRLATLVPLDPETHRPRELLARLEIAEEHAAEITPGQQVRLYSNLYNHRVHGTFVAVIERLEPVAGIGGDGKRYFQAVALIESPALPLLLGSGVKAEILLGRKRVYRIILEH